jgi:hypothetical protein
MLGKIKKIRADLLENRLNSGNFITILHKNSGKLSTYCPSGKHHPRTPMFAHVWAAVTTKNSKVAKWHMHSKM